jgi:hypothetical protein
VAAALEREEMRQRLLRDCEIKLKVRYRERLQDFLTPNQIETLLTVPGMKID